jgi:hypothetical protein
MDEPRTPTAIHGASGLKLHQSEKAYAIADCLEILVTPHDLCDQNHERRVGARVQALLKIVDNTTHQRIRLAEVNQFFEIGKGLRNLWHSK